MTVLIAMLFNLGVFAALIGLHLLLDCIKYRDHHKLTWSKTFEGMARENLVDGTLLLSALTFEAYLHHSFGLLAGLSGLARAEISIVRMLATTLPKLTILHNVLCILSNLQHYYETINPRLGTKLQPVERCYAAALVCTLTLLITAPFFLHLTIAEYMEFLLYQLTPGIV